MDSTGRQGARSARRRLLGLIALSPAAAWLPAAARLEATDYAGSREVLDAIDAFEVDVASRLEALEVAVPAARAFVESLSRDHLRHREDRRTLRRRLGLEPAPSPPDAAAEDVDLAGLRAAQEALVFAHAEGLPAMGDPAAVDTLARHMVDLSRHLTVIDLWIEGES